MSPRAGVDARELLSRLPLFAGLTSEQLGVISAGCSSVTLARGRVLFHQGDPVRGFFFVLGGQMQLSVSTGDGSEKVVEIVSAGESFGEAVVFDGSTYPVTATALVGTEMLAVASRAMLELLDRDPSFARRMLGNMAVRLRRLVRDVESYSLRTGEQRVIGFLLHNATTDDATTDKEGRDHVRLPVSKQILASRLNLTPETFSRVLHGLSAQSLISVRGRCIVLHDTTALRDKLAWR
ncbi:Crp/Fnr family transcriptional regulator [Streptomyces sp. RY43-2]|uniref:Crp/Fnr family transcriptional regulator n=1 Tax=Streptomyces macrolidinus TaxID=2952607 RepID=A0ABT0ZHL5_9ACTN|nr:Crp/Fnr family transcriptional regulator [Streptomyces macrolidinus]MCN9243069.1 Crp/Fnr family transcriptional regulator [Streptomyces macrolidinus]